MQTPEGSLPLGSGFRRFSLKVVCLMRSLKLKSVAKAVGLRVSTDQGPQAHFLPRGFRVQVSSPKRSMQTESPWRHVPNSRKRGGKGLWQVVGI